MTEQEERLYTMARRLVEQRTGKAADLSNDEDWYAAVDEARAHLGITEKAPVCAHCGDVAPYGDARNGWIDWHHSKVHIWWQKILRSRK